MLEAKLNYRSGLRIGNDITKWLSYEEAIKQDAAENVGGGGKNYRDVLGSSLIKYRIFSGFCDICNL
jgi:hypothetical protein